MLTEMLYWDKETGKLVSPFYTSDPAANPVTLRNVIVESSDINQDRNINPLTSVLPEAAL